MPNQEKFERHETGIVFLFPPNRLVAAILQLDTYFMERGAVTLEL